MRTDPQQHVDLFPVMVRMAALAVGRGVQQAVLLQFVPDLQVAVEAVDLVLGDVNPVHELAVADLFQVVRAIVADAAPLAGNLALPAYHVACGSSRSPRRARRPDRG